MCPSNRISSLGKGKAEKKEFFKKLHAKPFIKPFLSLANLTGDSFIHLLIHSVHLGITEALFPVEGIFVLVLLSPAHRSRARLRRVLGPARYVGFNQHWVWPLLLALGWQCLLQPLPPILIQ